MLVALFMMLDILIARPVWDDWKLGLSGVSVKAKPLSLKRQGTGQTTGNSVVSHDVRVRYEDEDGVEHEAELTSADRDVLDRAVAKKSLRIEYHPDEPELIRLEGENAALFGNFIFLPFFGALIGIFLVGMGVRRHRRGRRQPGA